MRCARASSRCERRCPLRVPRALRTSAKGNDLNLMHFLKGFQVGMVGEAVPLTLLPTTSAAIGGQVICALSFMLFRRLELGLTVLGLEEIVNPHNA